MHLLTQARLERTLENLRVTSYLNLAAKKLIGLMMTIFFVAHLLACLWYSNNNCYPKAPGGEESTWFGEGDESEEWDEAKHGDDGYKSWKVCMEEGRGCWGLHNDKK